MNLSAIYHQSLDNMCYCLNESELVIRIKTGYDVDQIYIHYGDPYIYNIQNGKKQWKHEILEITDKKRLEYQICWSGSLIAEFKRCNYFFEIVAKNERWIYSESGFYDMCSLPKEDLYDSTYFRYFHYPWMNRIDINNPPKWPEHRIWYQLFPDRFCKSGLTITSRKIEEWPRESNQTVKNEECYGGNLEGIIKQMDYLKNLGVTGIYLNPVNEAVSVHRYDTIDYFKIDPILGNKETMSLLVKEAHLRDIKVMLDGVFAHCSWRFPYWQDVVLKGSQSRYYQWFLINEWPFDDNYMNARNGKYYTFKFYDNMPKLNTSNQEVIDYICDVCESWITEYDIDALRLDVADELSHELYRQLRKRVRSKKNDFYLVGEILNDARSWLKSDELDSVMNYPLAYDLIYFWINSTLNKEYLEYRINEFLTMYMQQNVKVMFNLLETHDTIRLISLLENVDKVYQLYTLLFTLPGSVCIFYGSELLLKGKKDPDCRRCMPWDEIENGMYDERIKIMKKLIDLRKTESTLQSDVLSFVQEDKNNRLIHYIKTDDQNNKIQIYLNCSDEDIEMNFKEPVKFSRLYEDHILKRNGILIY
jgi:cyclomaltodextrinase / maltogenic alpha-amylase / neopullulanase